MKKENSKAAIQDQHFKISLTMRGISAEQATQAIKGYFPSSVANIAGNATTAITDHLERVWKVSLDGSGEEASTMISTPKLAYEDMDEFLYLVEDLKANGAQGGEGCGMSVFAAAVGLTERAIANLRSIVESKSLLLEKALVFMVDPDEKQEDGGDCQDVVILLGAASDLDTDEMKACIQLACAVIAQAVNQNRASAEVQRPENEKYAFRCWLNRMGLKSDEFKPLRMRFLKRLEGDASYKGGRNPRPVG